MKQHLPLSPCTPETALQKVQLAENAWNIQDPERISKAYPINGRKKIGY
ncbi:DUF1348 family protein [Chryseobacterium candidae]|uniref:DUF1348 family protein n=1 Tax=Chryseobacterium candidae TaxID=1978493 RepID=A0ABY2R4G1_9FLAO|nr:DUF1348 family protein [Chryseobacterium candidae]